MNANSPHVIFLTVDAETSQQRIDNFLRTFLKGVPKSRIYRLLRKGEVRVNKKRVKPDYKLTTGDIIRIPPIKTAEKKEPIISTKLDKIANLEQAILYEDDEMLVLNKPSGIAVHGGSGLNFGVIEAFRSLRPEARFLELVHRIDRETSGILLIAKKRSALRSLHEQLRLNQVSKNYLALVRGEWPSACKLVEAPLLKNLLQQGERRVNVNDKGKYAKTYFKVEERFDTATLVKASPLTGRTHQIRVHAQHMTHPIAFDDRYGDREFDKKLQHTGLNRLFLHALQLQFVHPKSEEKMTISAPLDIVLSDCLNALRQEKRYQQDRDD